MSPSVTTDAAPRRLATPLRLVCTEVWGGNRPIDAPIELPGIRGRIYSRPCTGGRGGDIHYLSVCGSGLIARLCVADVAGHGEPVAKVSSTIHHLLRRYMNHHDERHVLGLLNRHLNDIGLSALTTAAAVTYYPPARHLSVSYAGHPPAWLYRRAARRWVRMPAPAAPTTVPTAVNLPLAVEAGTHFTRIAETLAYGDRLLIVTDGVLEAPDALGQLYGAARLEGQLEKHRGADVAELVDRLVDSLGAHVGTTGLTHDDVTLLLVEFVPGPRGPVAWHVIRNRIVRPRGNGTDPAFADPRAAGAAAVAG